MQPYTPIGSYIVYRHLLQLLPTKERPLGAALLLKGQVKDKWEQVRQARQVAGQVAAMVLARQEQGQWEVAVMHAHTSDDTRRGSSVGVVGASIKVAVMHACPNCHLMQLQLGYLLQHCLLVDL